MGIDTVFISLADKAVVLSTGDMKQTFPVDCDPNEVKTFYEKYCVGKYVQYSSDVNHPREFNIPDGFDIDDWLHMALHPKQTYNLIDNDTIKVQFNPNKGEYEVWVKESSKVVVNF